MPAAQRRWRQVFAGEERQIRELRRWLAGLLPECATRDDAVTVAVELATNAVRHTGSGRGGWFAVEVTWDPFSVRIAVADQGAPCGPRLMENPDPLGETGRGLQVVRGLSARAGVTGGARGRVVQAEINWTGQGGGAEPAGFPGGHAAAVRDGEELLARRHAGVVAWSGQQAHQWQALAGDPATAQLLAADCPGELARLLDALDAATPAGKWRPVPVAAGDTAAARAGRAGARDGGHRRGAPVPPRPHHRLRPAGIRAGGRPC